MSYVPAICPQCGASIKIDSSRDAALCPACKTPFITQKAVDLYTKRQKKAISTNKSVLRDYLEKIRLLENDIYTFERITSELEREKSKCEEVVKTDISSRITEPLEPKQVLIPIPPDNSPPISSWLAWGSFICLVCCFLAGEIIDPSVFDPLFDTLFAMCIFFLITTIVMGIRASSVNDTRKKKIHEYEMSKAVYDNYLNELEAYKKSKATYDAQLIEYRYNRGEKIILSKVLSKQISRIQEDRSKTEAALNQLYALDIVYRKYWGIVPITMFCEYIDSGRRSVLAGEHGMYDLYESELLGKQIVGELQTVNNNLTAIKATLNNISHQLSGIQRNQMLLYEAVLEGNIIAKNIADEMSNQRVSAEEFNRSYDAAFNKLLDSAQLTAFHTEATARRVDSLAKIQEYEFAKRNPNMLRIYSTYN